MIISFHSYKGGTGKTNFIGNLGLHLARNGDKTCIIDSDINGPGIHSLFNVDFDHSLIDLVSDKCKLEDVVKKSEIEDKLYIVPTKITEEDLTSFFNTPSEAKEKMNQIIDSLKRDYSIKHVLIDCGPGMNRSSFLIMSIADKAVIVSTIDKQDIRGTYILTNMAKKLGSSPYLLFNKAPPARPDDMDDVITRFSTKLDTQLLGIVAYDKEVADTWSRKLITDSAPNSQYSKKIKEIASNLMSA